jgi:hypothetical protein
MVEYMAGNSGITGYSVLPRVYLDVDIFTGLSVAKNRCKKSGNFNSDFLLDTPKPVSYT